MISREDRIDFKGNQIGTVLSFENEQYLEYDMLEIFDTTDSTFESRPSMSIPDALNYSTHTTGNFQSAIATISKPDAQTKCKQCGKGINHRKKIEKSCPIVRYGQHRSIIRTTIKESAAAALQRVWWNLSLAERNRFIASSRNIYQGLVWGGNSCAVDSFCEAIYWCLINRDEKCFSRKFRSLLGKVLVDRHHAKVFSVEHLESKMNLVQVTRDGYNRRKYSSEAEPFLDPTDDI